MIFEGIYVPLITPFRPDLSIDFDAWGEVIDWQLQNGTHGIIVGGSTGEFFSLSQDERISQLEFAKQRLKGRVPLVAGVNDLQAASCYDLAAAARDIGVVALLVAAPPYALPSQKELAAHCLEIDRIADLPIMLYNYPGRTGSNMAAEFLHRVAQSSNVCAIKESSGDIDRIHLLAREYPQLQLSAGAEHQVLEFFAWGARSWVSVVANFFPRAAVRFYEACVVNGDFALGRRIMSAFLPLMYCLERGGNFLQSVKYACEIMHRPGGPVRPPFLPLEEEARREVFQIVTTANDTLRHLLEASS